MDGQSQFEGVDPKDRFIEIVRETGVGKRSEQGLTTPGPKKAGVEEPKATLGGGSVKLSDPVILNARARMRGVTILATGLILSVVGIFLDAWRDGTVNWPLMWTGLGCVLGIVILIMGYRKVDISSEENSSQ